jgi:tRNA-2-methylthio-N6-dimethylallyladenosine synthase
MQKYLYIETFGCQMNVNDSEKIAALLQGEGYELTADRHAADLLILNTCSVRAKAEERVYGQLATYRGLKRRRPGMLLGVGGCVAQQEGERLLERLPHLDFVFGTHMVHQLPEIVADAHAGRRQVLVDFLDADQRKELFPARAEGQGVSRFVTIIQGCDNFCSYCVVPHVRGREVSRRSSGILREVRQMAESGVREVTLLGQNVNSYGLKDPEEMDFPCLLRRVAEIPGIERLRFITSHPKDISPQLIACYADLPQLASHIHLPLQAGSDRILAQMNRGYTTDEYLAVVDALRQVRPNIQFTGDMIVGFPGETEEEFAATLAMMERVRYVDLYSFMYSPRPGTAAAAMADDLTRAVKQERLSRLQQKQRETTLAIHREYLGQRHRVLVEGNSKRGDHLMGRTSCNQIVLIDGPRDLVGSMVTVAIVDATVSSLTGTVVVDQVDC